MKIKVTSVFKHDGQTLSPKLVYSVPQTMGEFLTANGLATASTAAVDIDLSHLTWAAETTLFVSGSPIVPGGSAHK